MTRLAVFAYGSLVDPASAALTLGRPVESAAPATLAGWTRGWILCRDNLASEKTFARGDGSLPSFCLALGVEPAERDPGTGAAPGVPEDADPNGALLEVTEAELERLDLRELRYHRVEVTEAIAAGIAPRPGADPNPGAGLAPGAFDRVFTYRPRPEHLRPTAPDDAIVVAAYVRAVEVAFAALGPEHLERFRATTTPPPVEVCEAGLVGDRIPAGNPRGW